MKTTGFTIVLLALVVGACSPPVRSSADTSARPARSMIQAEAEKACGGMTDFSPETLPEKPPETQALLRREYDLCVAAVTKEGGDLAAAPASTPGLRGRSETSPRLH